MKYRAEIDGLRALAVMPVILFHAGFEWFSGGFVGVDIFFVISGYLITTIIISEMAEGNFSIVNFYERRARRILPALFFVMLICLPFAWLWLTPSDLKDFGQSLVATSTFSSNILFWLKTGYFNASADITPLIHTWSLAVEEQYYILFPIFLMLTWRLGVSRISIILSVSFLISLGAAHWGAYNLPDATFYLLPTRGWELLIGAFLAFYLQYNTYLKPHYLNEALSLLGFGMIIYSIVTFNDLTPFPSLYTLIPTLGAGLLILTAVPNTIAHNAPILKPVVGIGLISYSVYLWHQPLLAFARHRMLGDVTEFLLLGICAASLLIAWFSWRYIERPFRENQKIKRKTIFSLSLLLSLAFLVIGLFLHFENGVSKRFKYTILHIPTVKDQKCHNNPNTKDIQKILASKFCKIGKLDVSPDTFLVGDSHAGSISDQLGEAFNKNQRSLYSFSGGFCAPAVGFSLEISGAQCTKQVAEIFSYILKDDSIKNVVISANWSNYIMGFRDTNTPQRACINNTCVSSITENASLFKKAFLLTLNRLIDARKNIFIIYPAPEFQYQGNKLFYLDQLRDVSAKGTIPFSKYSDRNSSIINIFDEVVNEQIKTIKVKDIFCADDLCKIFNAEGLPLFSDTTHLNDLGANLVVERIMLSGL